MLKLSGMILAVFFVFTLLSAMQGSAEWLTPMKEIALSINKM